MFRKVMDDKDKCKLQEDLNKLVSWAQTVWYGIVVFNVPLDTL